MKSDFVEYSTNSDFVEYSTNSDFVEYPTNSDFVEYSIRYLWPTACLLVPTLWGGVPSSKAP